MTVSSTGYDDELPSPSLAARQAIEALERRLER